MQRRPAAVILAAAFVLATACGPRTEPGPAGSPVADPATRVDPFVGTGGHGHTFPGATLPFGMVQLGPDTRLEGWDGCSGYHDSDSVVYGFSHTHLSGTGISDYGDVLFMPAAGTALFDNGYRTGPDEGYASRFDKGTERAEPGYYAVVLADYGVDVELTVTERTGLHRYRWPRDSEATLIVDLEHRDRVLDSSIRVVDDREIEGTRRSTGWARDQVVHFVARFSRPFTAELAEAGAVVAGAAGATELSGTALQARLRFDGIHDGADAGELLVRVGLSSVDVDGARRNLDDEQGERGFDEVRAAAAAAWNAALGKIEVTGGTQEQQEIFYTALYHTMIAPNVWSDVDGRYLGMDGAVHRAEVRRYTVFSLWDTFRAAHPLYTILEPERTREFVETFLAQYEQGGRLPVWELAANETDTMIGYHAVPVIADAWVKGIRGYDGERALEAMLHSARLDHFGLEAYKRQGFIGVEDDAESVSKTLEYAYDDWCIARMAADLGRDEVAAEFDRRSGGWRHLLDPETGFMRPRRNQRWLEPFDPRQVDNNYTEANAWQYRFFVPHDNDGLIAALGGDEAFLRQLDALFEAPSETTGRDQADITGMIGQYAHGNEPSHHMAWLYHYAGRPDGSARRVRRILDELYTAEPDGLSGNEDCGQMSAWYVFAAAGLYPATPCTDEYVLVPPLFDAVTFRPEGGRPFTVAARGRPSSGPAYVVVATLDGEPLTRSFVRHAEIAAGGELILELGTEPGAWGTAAPDRPRTGVAGPALPAAPFLSAPADRFRDTLTFELLAGDPDAKVRYTLDGAGSPDGWAVYQRPLTVDRTTRVRFVAERAGVRSPVVESVLHRIEHDWTVVLDSRVHPQYTAGGVEALVDGLPGDADWRTGGWVGIQQDDLAATVDLGEVRPVARAGARFLQDQRAWIWMPAGVAVSLSADGETFHEVARLGHDVAADAEGAVVRELAAGLPAGTRARYVRVQAANFGVCPDWHPGAGGDAYIFLDEILVE